MPVLAPNQPVTQSKAVLLVENKLAVGRHRFSLVVTDGSGNESDPVTLVVTVRSPFVIGPGGIRIVRPGKHRHDGAKSGEPR